MLCFSSSLLRRGNHNLPKQFSSILRITHFSFPIFSSASLLSESDSLVKTKSLSDNISKESVFSGLRFDRTMATQSSAPQSVHDFTVKDAKGNEVDLSMYKGKVLLIVNVASQWYAPFLPGYYHRFVKDFSKIAGSLTQLTKKKTKFDWTDRCETSFQELKKSGLTNSNYTELTNLYEKYKNEGLEILAFPCNQFGSEEPGTNEEIQQFACTRFKADYPIFDKVEVNGSNTAPIYKFLKSSKGGVFGDSIKWNFSKFLVDKNGNVVDRYAPTTSPLSIEKDIKKLLGTA